MGKVTAIRQFASLVAGERVTISRNRIGWSASMSEMRITLPVDLMENDELDKLFRKDFINRCPLAQGFANVTLSILHEIGHLFRREEFISFDAKVYDTTYGEAYFHLLPEIVATNWAIAWLQNPTHRKQAKAFEKEFFGY